MEHKEESTRKKELLRLYSTICLIRSAEDAIIAHYGEDEMKTPMHMSRGEEGIVAGLVAGCKGRGEYMGTYRSHALYLAVTEETDAFFGEMYGKATGPARGKAGSMHLSAPEKGLLGTSAIVASLIPVATGVAFYHKTQGSEKIAVVCFGDGAVDEGNFWESLNLACVKRLPVLFVCEDNGFAVHTSSSARHGYTSLPEVVRQFDCNVFETEETDAEEIMRITQKAVTKIREENKPSLLYAKYYRYLEHIGIREDFDRGYRGREEFEKWKQKDPKDVLEKKMLSLGIREKELREIGRKTRDQVEESIKKAKAAPFPDVKETYEGVYA